MKCLSFLHLGFGSQWPLSCRSGFKSKPSLPHAPRTVKWWISVNMAYKVAWYCDNLLVFVLCSGIDIWYYAVCVQCGHTRKHKRQNAYMFLRHLTDAAEKKCDWIRVMENKSTHPIIILYISRKKEFTTLFKPFWYLYPWCYYTNYFKLFNHLLCCSARCPVFDVANSGDD